MGTKSSHIEQKNRIGYWDTHAGVSVVWLTEV